MVRARLPVGLALFALALVIGGASPAEASLINTDVTVTFQEPGFLDEQDVVGVGAGSEIAFGDGTNIGQNIMLDGEFIDIGDAWIVYRVRGDGPAHAMSGYQTTGFDPTAQYLFSDLFWLGEPGIITGVTVTLTDVIGVEVGSQVLFTDHSVTLVIGTLGVLENPGGLDLGTIRLDLQVQHGAVPEPGAFALCAIGLFALATRRLRTR